MTFYLTISNVIYGAAQWCIFSLLTKSGDLGLVADYALSFATTAPVFLLFGLNFRTVISVDVDGRYKDHHYMQARLVYTFVAFLICLVIGSFYSPRVWALIVCTSMIKSTETLSEAFNGWHQREGKQGIQATCRVVKAVLSIGLFSVLYFPTKNVYLGMMGHFLGYAVMLWFESPTLSEKLSCRVNWKQVSKIGASAFPLGMVSVMDSISQNLPRYLLAWFAMKELIAIYSGLAYFLFIGGAFITAVGSVLVPRLAKHYKAAQYEEFRRAAYLTLISCTGVSALMVFVFFIFGARILSILYTPSFSIHYREFSVLSVSVIFWFIASVLGFVLISTGRLIQNVKAHAAMMVCGISMGIVLIGKFGLMGASITLVAMMLVRSLVSLVFSFGPLGMNKSFFRAPSAQDVA